MSNYEDKYLKYKTKYLQLKNQENKKVGGQIKIQQKKIKLIEYDDEKLYILNTIDSDKLNEYSEFPIGSITKLFTIISLLLLHQKNKININSTIGKYIDNSRIANLKIIDIMNHKSGLKNMYDNVEYGYSKKKYNSATEVYNSFIFNGSIINTQSGTYAYSNIGYHLLGVLIEKISNMTYSNFIKKNILVPLKMNNTGIEDCNITLYNHKNKKLTKFQKWERTFASSAGELKSCVNDLINFSKFFKLLNKDSINLLKKLYCFNENKEDNTFSIGHNGGISGSSSRLTITFNKNFVMKKTYVYLETIVN
jgi:CubicO group peptidase (beta-lactamase class C family)